jgi:hypothetical protein
MMKRKFKNAKHGKRLLNSLRIKKTTGKNNLKSTMKEEEPLERSSSLLLKLFIH